MLPLNMRNREMTLKTEAVLTEDSSPIHKTLDLQSHLSVPTFEIPPLRNFLGKATRDPPVLDVRSASLLSDK